MERRDFLEKAGLALAGIFMGVLPSGAQAEPPWGKMPEFVRPPPLDKPRVVKGDLETTSRDSYRFGTIGLFVEGGDDPEWVAGAYAPLFADRRYTDMPINVVFVYGKKYEPGKERPKVPRIIVYFEGERVGKVPMDELHLYINSINHQFVEGDPDRRLKKVISIP